MPIKIKPSIKHTDRKTGATRIEHFFMKQASIEELLKLLDSDFISKKLKQKIRNELARRKYNG